MNNELIKKICSLMLVNNISFIDDLFETYSNLKELSLLQRKRRFENLNLNSNDNFSFQKEINFRISNVDKDQNKNDVRINGHCPIEQKNAQIQPIINLSEFKENNTEFEPKNICSNYANSDKSNMKEVLINNNVNNEKYLFGNNLNFNNINNISNFFVDDEKENKLINSINPRNVPNNSYPEENGNKIKVFKNNKTVYMNSFWLYNPLKKEKCSKNSLIQNGRSSKYRGVSRNGNNWQVFMMINRAKTYIGTYPTEEIAARVYDIMSIKYRGIKAKTNFIYNNDQIKMIKELEIDVKSKNIYEIISNLFACNL